MQHPNYNKTQKSKSVQVTKKEKKMMIKSDPTCPVFTKGVGLPLPMHQRGLPTVKIFDSNVMTISPTTTPQIFGLFAPSQGPSITQRIGDVVYVRNMAITYTCNAANADVFSSLRLIVFQWIPNNALAAPSATSILQLTSDGVYAFYDVNFEGQYRILMDHIHSFSGTFTAPTASSNQCCSQKISLAPAFHRITFSNGAVTCDRSFYLLAVSDSAIAPTPNLTFKTRITFEEEG